MAQPHLSHDSYRVGIICALATEKAAIEAMLDQEHDRLSNLPEDENDYTLGRIGVHNVVVACLPAGLVGKASAATVAKDIRRSFPIKIGLLAGIGGGVWSEKCDIRLGDVVDFGEMEQNGGFHRTGSLNGPPRPLLNALQRIKTEHEKWGNGLSKCLASMTTEFPRMVNYSYQGLENDQLFKPTYCHQQQRTCCDRCDISELVDWRPLRTSTEPMIHYGNIASGDAVMKDGVLRDRIAKQEGVKCFEMEAAGLMDNFPCLVIRGICDYADSHKNDRWQKYAAATAAAYVKELLRVIDKQGVDELPPAGKCYTALASAESTGLLEQSKGLLEKIFQEKAFQEKDFLEKDFLEKGSRTLGHLRYPQVSTSRPTFAWGVGKLNMTPTDADECFNCGVSGHWATDCFTQPSTIEAFWHESGACLGCGAKGHWQQECPKWPYRARGRCFKCDTPGHWQEDCFKFWHPTSRFDDYPY